MKYYHVDAFTKTVFTGNPAVVCLVEEWPSAEVMQRMALEHNLSETAFVAPEGAGYRLRWFTPGGEIDLCGHATLAAAYVLSRFVAPREQRFLFHTVKHDLLVTKQGELFSLEFPAYTLLPVAITPAMTAALGVEPVAAYMGRDLVCVLPTEEEVRHVVPNQAAIQALDGLLCHITARSTAYDCVSRTFAPKCAVAEDPVCGSGHCHLVPLWAQTLGKKRIHAYQASPRGGELYGTVSGNKVILSGYACLYSQGEVMI